MATGYEKINAIKSLLKTKMTVAQMANLLNCGPRTVFRHLEVLTNENCGLRRTKENGQTYYVIQTNEEVNFNQTIVKQLEKIKKNMGSANAQDIKNVKLVDKIIEQLGVTNPDEFKPEAITTDPDYILDYGPFSDNKLQSTSINRVLKAIHDHFMIKISYRPSSHEAEPSIFELRPVKVIMRMDTLYLIAADETYEETGVFKNFLFENIISVQETNTAFQKIAFDAAIHYKYAFGKYTAMTKPEEVSLLVKNKWLQTQFERSHFTPEASKRMDKDGNMIVDLKLRLTPDFKTWLLGVSPDVKILKPASLKEEIKEMLKKTLAEMDD
ncbi:MULTISPECIES: YafY family protein [unclassified Fibrobacter]|uniref:helix-turn-helix transcriptional regulator n=1 Tax=unclassified Fibrobacter TaxID=2634177 RepID=UPI000D6CEFB5|nr:MULTISPECIES: WYL domain-containing protein [unclassified Fibrobacter]PWJ61040.1 putative DNA-binding transcriptional regulator YafY [Fibrobacter sp. UWR4]PZW68061.1 putative DNA-binding transcriptional regulator YafY [Fibrobacter sp. UWR1]